MSATKRLRSTVPLFALATAVIVLAALHPLSTRDAAEYAVALWWNHMVPMMFPAYVLAQALMALWPRSPLAAWMILAFLTFPPIVAVALLDGSRSGRVAPRDIVPLLLYTNLYNPLFFPHPSFALAMDGALLTSALILCPPGRIVAVPPPRRNLTPRQWVVDGMNWTSIAGLVTLAAWILHRWFTPLGAGWAVDPLTLHWASQRVSMPAVFFTAFGGLAYWTPLLSTRRMPQRRQLLLYRLAQSALASALVMILGVWFKSGFWV